MPAQEGVSLDDKEGLLPEWRRSGKKEEPDAVSIAQLRAFDLAMQDDQLLAEECVIRNELGFAGNGVLNHAYEE